MKHSLSNPALRRLLSVGVLGVATLMVTTGPSFAGKHDKDDSSKDNSSKDDKKAEKEERKQEKAEQKERDKADNSHDNAKHDNDGGLHNHAFDSSSGEKHHDHDKRNSPENTAPPVATVVPDVPVADGQTAKPADANPNVLNTQEHHHKNRSHDNQGSSPFNTPGNSNPIPVVPPTVDATNNTNTPVTAPSTPRDNNPFPLHHKKARAQTPPLPQVSTGQPSGVTNPLANVSDAQKQVLDAHEAVRNADTPAEKATAQNELHEAKGNLDTQRRELNRTDHPTVYQPAGDLNVAHTAGNQDHNHPDGFVPLTGPVGNTHGTPVTHGGPIGGFPHAPVGSNDGQPGGLVPVPVGLPSTHPIGSNNGHPIVLPPGATPQNGIGTPPLRGVVIKDTKGNDFLVRTPDGKTVRVVIPHGEPGGLERGDVVVLNGAYDNGSYRAKHLTYERWRDADGYWHDINDHFPGGGYNGPGGPNGPGWNNGHPMPGGPGGYPGYPGGSGGYPGYPGGYPGGAGNYPGGYPGGSGGFGARTIQGKVVNDLKGRDFVIRLYNGQKLRVTMPHGEPGGLKRGDIVRAYGVFENGSFRARHLKFLRRS